MVVVAVHSVMMMMMIAIITLMWRMNRETNGRRRLLEYDEWIKGKRRRRRMTNIQW